MERVEARLAKHGEILGDHTQRLAECGTNIIDARTELDTLAQITRRNAQAIARIDRVMRSGAGGGSEA